MLTLDNYSKDFASVIQFLRSLTLKGAETRYLFCSSCKLDPDSKKRVFVGVEVSKEKDSDGSPKSWYIHGARLKNHFRVCSAAWLPSNR